MENFNVTKSPVNKILSIVKKIKKKKNREEKILYMVNCMIKRRRDPKHLFLSVKQYERGCKESKELLLNSPLFHSADEFWTDAMIKFFEESTDFFVRTRRSTTQVSLDQYDEKEVVVKPDKPELQEIMTWFSFLFSIVPETQESPVLEAEMAN